MIAHKSSLSIVLSAALLLALLTAGQALAGQANVFIYHRFGESRYPSTNISLENFKAHLEVLKQSQVEVVSLGDLVDLLLSGKPLDKHYAVLTVDDGYQSFLSGAMPLLREYHFPVTLFVNTDAVGGRGYLGWDELAGLVKEDVELGNHTASHPHMTDVQDGESAVAWKRRISADLQRAAAAFSEQLGITPELFAYPYGEFSPAVQQLVRAAGFRAAIAQQSGVVVAGTDMYALPRFPMGGPYVSLDQFRSKLAMRALPIELVGPVTTLVGEKNPPLLEVHIDPELVDLRQLSCYVTGQDTAKMDEVEGRPGHYRIQARKPLTGRRSKYTLTAPGKSGGWYWFSQLWIRPEVDEGGY